MAELPAREAMEFDVVVVGAGPVRPGRRHPPQADQSGYLRGGGGEGLRGRRPYPLRRGDRSGRPRPAAARLALRGYADQDRGHRRSLLLSVRRRRAAASQFHDAAADEQSRQLHRFARQCLPLAGDQSGRPRRRNLSGLCRGGSSLRCKRRGRGRCHRRHGRRQEWRAEGQLHARHGAAREIHAVRGRRARQSRQATDCEVRSGERARAAEIRARPEGALAGRAGETPQGSGAAHVRLAARQFDRRRLVPLSPRRQSGVGRLRPASQLFQSLSLAVRGIPALQDSSAGARHVRRRQAARLRRARADRRRLPVGAEVELSRRRADRLRCRLHERAAHQGQPQRHAVGNDGGGSRGRGAFRRPQP